MRTVLAVPSRRSKSKRKLPARISVPVSDTDAAYLERIKATTELRMSAISRLLFHRGIMAHRRDGKLAD